MSRRIQTEDIVRAFLRAQRLVRKLNREGTTPLTLDESNLLISIEQNAESKPSDLADKLTMTRSKVSRIIKRLDTSKLIKQTTALEDSRSSLLTLTSKGKKQLALFDDIYNEQTSSWSEHLSKKQLNALISFLKELATELGAPYQKKRSAEHPLRTEQRRIAQAGGLLSGALFNSQMNLIEYHIMQDLMESDGPLPLEVLSSLPFDLAQVSRTTDMLVKAGWIKKKPDPKDKRRGSLKLLARGKNTFRKAETLVASLFDSISCLSGANRTSLYEVLCSIASLDSKQLKKTINHH